MLSRNESLVRYSWQNMKNILLVCSAGMSTSLLAYRMERAAEGIGLNCRVEAHPVSELSEYCLEADILMMGPQDRFLLKNVKATCPSKPIVVIDPRDYGAMNGEKVLEKARKEIKKFYF